MRGIYEQIIEKFKGNEQRAASQRPPETMIENKEAEINNTRLKYEKIK